MRQLSAEKFPDAPLESDERRKRSLQLTQIRPSGIIECQNPQKGTGGKAVDFLLIRMGQNMGKTSLDTAAWITLCDACL